MDAKIKKKAEELERTEKRLRSLENVRPQFVEEIEKLELELQAHYEVYVTKYRNLDYLEHELSVYHKAEEERREENERKLKKMREKLLKAEVELLRGNGEVAHIQSNSNIGNMNGEDGLFGRNSNKQFNNNGNSNKIQYNNR